MQNAARAMKPSNVTWTDYGAALEILRRMELAASVEGDLVGHEDRVARTTRSLAREAGLDREDVDRMTVSARYHDIGKLRISPDILRKPGALSPDERASMERHAELGAAALGKIQGIDPMMVDAALYHHERFDGNGYAGLAGEEIPLVARVVAIADVHDALVQKRSYKPARPEAEVLAMMTADERWPSMGRDAFDPGLLRKFVAMRLADPDFQAAEDVRLSHLSYLGAKVEDVRPALAAFASSPVPEPELAPAP